MILALLDDTIAFPDHNCAQTHITHNNPLSDVALLTLGEITRTCQT